MSDLQTLPSSYREKQRYLVFDIIADEPPRFGPVVGTIWDAALDFLGEKGVADADIWVMKDQYDAEQGQGMLRVRKDAVDEVRAALALIQEIGADTVTVHVLGVTGTVNSARDKYF